MSQDPAPVACTELICCSCASLKCQTQRCSCYKQTLECTDMCMCQNGEDCFNPEIFVLIYEDDLAT